MLWSIGEGLPVAAAWEEFPTDRLRRLVKLWSDIDRWDNRRGIGLETFMHRLAAFHIEHPRAHFTYRQVAGAALIACCLLSRHDATRICRAAPLALSGTRAAKMTNTSRGYRERKQAKPLKRVPSPYWWGVDAEKVAERFWELRCKLDLSVSEMARMFGVHRDTLSSWERAARRPRKQSMVLLEMMETGHYPPLLEEILEKRAARRERVRKRVMEYYSLE